MQSGDQKNPQTNYRKQFMSTKEQQNRAILANSSISTYDNGEMRHIQTKTSIWIHSWSNQFWNRIANVSVKKDEESSYQNLFHVWKNSTKISWSYTHQDIEQKDKYLHFPSYMSEKQFSTRSMTRVNLENFIFFLVFADQKHSSGTSRATNEQEDDLNPLILLKIEYCGKRRRVSKNS